MDSEAIGTFANMVEEPTKVEHLQSLVKKMKFSTNRAANFNYFIPANLHKIIRRIKSKETINARKKALQITAVEFQETTFLTEAQIKEKGKTTNSKNMRANLKKSGQKALNQRSITRISLKTTQKPLESYCIAKTLRQPSKFFSARM